MAEAGTMDQEGETPAATGLWYEILKNTQKRKGVNSDLLGDARGVGNAGKRTKQTHSVQSNVVRTEPRQGTSRDTSDIAPPLPLQRGVTSSDSARANLGRNETSGNMAAVQSEVAMHSTLWKQQADVMVTISQRLANMEKTLGGLQSAPLREKSDTDDGECREVDDEIDSFLTTEMEEDNSEQEQDCVDIMADVEGFLLDSTGEGPAVEDKLAKIVNSGVRALVQPEKLKLLQEKHLKPSNCGNLTVPKTNKEAWQGMSKASRSADIAMQKVQGNVGLALVPAIKMMEVLNKHKQSKTVPIEEVRMLTSDIFKMMTAVFSDCSTRRKELIKPDLRDGFQQICATTNPVTDYLFGDDLHTQVKALNESKRAGSQLLGKKSEFLFAKQGSSRYHTNNSKPFLGKSYPQSRGSYAHRPASRGHQRPQANRGHQRFPPKQGGGPQRK